MGDSTVGRGLTQISLAEPDSSLGQALLFVEKLSDPLLSRSPLAQKATTSFLSKGNNAPFCRASLIKQTRLFPNLPPILARFGEGMP